jgi:uncharacterized protein (UPF0262 family)
MEYIPFTHPQFNQNYSLIAFYFQYTINVSIMSTIKRTGLQYFHFVYQSALLICGSHTPSSWNSEPVQLEAINIKTNLPNYGSETLTPA